MVSYQFNIRQFITNIFEILSTTFKRYLKICKTHEKCTYIDKTSKYARGKKLIFQFLGLNRPKFVFWSVMI